MRMKTKYRLSPQREQATGWHDISSRSQGQVDRTPTTWELRFSSFRLVLTHHIAFPGKWVLNFEPDFRNLEFADIGQDVDQLKEAAERLAAKALRSALSELEPN